MNLSNLREQIGLLAQDYTKLMYEVEDHQVEKKFCSFAKPVTTPQTCSGPGWVFPSVQRDHCITTESQSQVLEICIESENLMF